MRCTSRTSRRSSTVRFYRGESLTVMRFGGRVLAERSVTYDGQRDLDRLRGFVAADDFGDSTAIWSTLDHAYQEVATVVHDRPGQAVSIVLMTDGENNAGMDLDAFIRRYGARPQAARAVRPARSARVRVTCATEGLRNQVPQRAFSARCLGKVQDWNAEDAVLEVQAMAIFR
ncbi:hypothetical protein OG729_08155 [Streptomyces sp. NBC_00210]|uniref:hypothetical protein n=1 Tax=unclassified Streptomyces TaxID=2593676 RepID=UPI00324FE201